MRKKETRTKLHIPKFGPIIDFRHSPRSTKSTNTKEEKTPWE